MQEGKVIKAITKVYYMIFNSRKMEDWRFKQKEAELLLSIMNLILTVAIFLLAFAGNIVLTSINMFTNVSLFTDIWLVVFVIGFLLFIVGVKGYYYYHELILDFQEKILSENFEKKSLNSLQQHKNDINSDDDINKNEENDCPFSSKDWIFFLGNEITNVENEGYRNFNYVYPAFAIFAAILAILINSMFSTANNAGISADGKSNIFYAIFQGWVALNIVFYGLFLGFILVVIEFFVKLKKANILREIRNNVLKGSLKNTNQIHKKWENVMQLKYRELIIMVFTWRLE